MNRNAPEFYTNLKPREKTGREFCDELMNRQSRMRSIRNEFGIGYFNPVNKDHRRLFEEKSENEPEWVHGGPSSRFDTVELVGFDEYDAVHGQTSSSSPIKRPPVQAQVHQEMKPQPQGGGSGGNQGSNYNHPFQFDEFLGVDNTIFNNRRGSNFRRLFQQNQNRFRMPQQQQQHQVPQQPYPGFDLNENALQAGNAGNVLLNLLHGQSKWPEHPLMDEPESNQNPFWNQLNQNRQYLAGKAMLEVLSAVATQQSQRAPQQQQAPVAPPAPPPVPRSPQNEQVLRMFELHRQIQAQNPGLAYQANNPQFWEDINQRQRAYYQQYAQQHPTSPRKSQQQQQQQQMPRNKNHRHVHFSPQSQEERIAQFFQKSDVSGQQPQPPAPAFDPEKAMKVEEFERKIKEAAATCKRSTK